jgi:hypothetical protein
MRRAKHVMTIVINAFNAFLLLLLLVGQCRVLKMLRGMVIRMTLARFVGIEPILSGSLCVSRNYQSKIKSLLNSQGAGTLLGLHSMEFHHVVRVRHSFEKFCAFLTSQTSQQQSCQCTFNLIFDQHWYCHHVPTKHPRWEACVSPERRPKAPLARGAKPWSILAIALVRTLHLFLHEQIAFDRKQTNEI